VFSVLLDVARPFSGDVCIRKDGLHRAFGLTGAAVDAFIGMDIELILGLVDTIYRADLDAAGVFGLDARLGDDVGHGCLKSMEWYGAQKL
jgi:hypothetical protein